MYAALDRFEDALALELVLRKHNCSSSYGGRIEGTVQAKFKRENLCKSVINDY
jgi:hypothetical protein